MDVWFNAINPYTYRFTNLHSIDHNFLENSYDSENDDDSSNGALRL